MTTPKRAHFSTAFAADTASPALPKPESTTDVGEKPLPLTKSRRNKVQIPVYVVPEVRTQLKIMSAELGRTQEALLREALNDFFRKHGKPGIG